MCEKFELIKLIIINSYVLSVSDKIVHIVNKKDFNSAKYTYKGTVILYLHLTRI